MDIVRSAALALGRFRLKLHSIAQKFPCLCHLCKNISVSATWVQTCPRQSQRALRWQNMHATSSSRNVGRKFKATKRRMTKSCPLLEAGASHRRCRTRPRTSLRRWSNLLRLRRPSSGHRRHNPRSHLRPWSTTLTTCLPLQPLQTASTQDLLLVLPTPWVAWPSPTPWVTWVWATWATLALPGPPCSRWAPSLATPPTPTKQPSTQEGMGHTMATIISAPMPGRANATGEYHKGNVTCGRHTIHRPTPHSGREAANHHSSHSPPSPCDPRSSNFRRHQLIHLSIWDVDALH